MLRDSIANCLPEGFEDGKMRRCVWRPETIKPLSNIVIPDGAK